LEEKRLLHLVKYLKKRTIQNFLGTKQYTFLDRNFKAVPRIKCGGKITGISRKPRPGRMWS
jgi:hypothetical protein